MNQHKEFMEDLNKAHIHAQRALEAILRPNGVKRGVWYRWVLSRAQNDLKSLYIQELRKSGQLSHE